MPQLASMPHDHVIVLSPSPEEHFVFQQACMVHLVLVVLEVLVTWCRRIRKICQYAKMRTLPIAHASHTIRKGYSAARITNQRPTKPI